MTVFKKIFNRQWWWTTLLVILGMIVLTRLGFWQLDRLEQRQAHNALLYTQWTQEPIDFTTESVPDDPTELRFRQAQTQGQFDYENQIVITNQNLSQQPGLRIITPLTLGNGKALLVDRGWISYKNYTDAPLSQYDEAANATVAGVVLQSQKMPSGQTAEIPESAQLEWYRVDIEAIQSQMPYELLPVFVQQFPEEGRTFDQLPIRVNVDRGLDEGSHLSYAVQWFSFAVIFGFGYLQFITFQERRALLKESAAESDTEANGDQPVAQSQQALDRS